MTDDAEDLYNSLMLEHSRSPRNFGPLPGATRTARGDNPFCGDHVTVALVLADGQIVDLRFEGTACAVSTASASMMTDRLKGRTAAEAEALYRRFEGMLGGAEEPPRDLGDLAAFAAVRRFPVRLKCARLPWRTLLAALGGDRSQTVTTE